MSGRIDHSDYLEHSEYTNLDVVEWRWWFHGRIYLVGKEVSALQMQVSISCIHGNNNSRIPSLLDSFDASIPCKKPI